VNTRLLVDSGVGRSCVSERTLKRVAAHKCNSLLKVTKAADSIRLLSATGSPLQTIVEVVLDVRLQSHVIPLKFMVVRNLHHSTALGMDMLQACRAAINLNEKLLCLFDDLIAVPLITVKDNANALCMIRRVRVSARSETILPVRLVDNAEYAFDAPASRNLGLCSEHKTFINKYKRTLNRQPAVDTVQSLQVVSDKQMSLGVY
jgi:hypothetical protein